MAYHRQKDAKSDFPPFSASSADRSSHDMSQKDITGLREVKKGSFHLEGSVPDINNSVDALQEPSLTFRPRIKNKNYLDTTLYVLVLGVVSSAIGAALYEVLKFILGI